MRYAGDEYDKASFRAMLGLEWAASAGNAIVARYRTLVARYRECREYVRELEQLAGVEPRDLGPEPDEPGEARAVRAVANLISSGVVHRKAQLLRLCLRHRAGIELKPEDVVNFGFDGATRVPVLVWGEEAELLGLTSTPALEIMPAHNDKETL